MYGEAGKLSMLKRNITGEEVGRMGFALLTDLAGGVTGETVHVDAGFHAIGMFLGQDDDAGDAPADGSAA